MKKNLIEIIEKKSKNNDQMNWYIKLIVEWLLTNDNYKKQCIINWLYNLEFEL